MRKQASAEAVVGAAVAVAAVALCCGCGLASAASGLVSTQHTLRYDGDANIGILVNLHHGSSSIGSSSSKLGMGRLCGSINAEVVQQVVAAKWAVDVINNQSAEALPKIGLQVHDTCESSDLLEKHLFGAISATRPLAAASRGLRIPTLGPPLLGLIVIGDASSLGETSGALSAFQIPVIAVQLPQPPHNGHEEDAAGEPRAAAAAGAAGVGGEILDKYDNLLTTMPDVTEQIRAILQLASFLKLSSLSLLSFSGSAIKQFESEAKRKGFSVRASQQLRRHDREAEAEAHTGAAAGRGDLSEQLDSFMRRHLNKDLRPAIVLIASGEDVQAVAESLGHGGHGPGHGHSEHGGRKKAHSPHPTWIVSSFGLDAKKSPLLQSAFDGALYVEPYLPEMAEFKRHFMRSLQSTDSAMHDLLQEFKVELFGCASSAESSRSASAGRFVVPCDKIDSEEIEMRFRPDPRVSLTVKAVSALTAAFRLLRLEQCQQQTSTSCLRGYRGTSDLHRRILANLRQLSFSSSAVTAESDLGHDDKVSRQQLHRFAANGRLVANKLLVQKIVAGDGMKLVGWFSEEGELHLTTHVVDEMTSASHAEADTHSNSAQSRDTGDGSTYAKSIADEHLVNALPVANSSGSGSLDPLLDPLLSISPSVSFAVYLSRTWALVIISMAILGFTCSVWMLVYVFIKLYDGTLAGNQSLGLLLLLGVIGLFCSVLAWLMPPDDTVCAVRHLLHPILMTLCFSILLAKAMQLRSMVSLGLGGSMPQVNQLVSLFFMMVVQMVIALEWFVSTRPERSFVVVDGNLECTVSRPRFLLLHAYPAALILLAFFYVVSVINHSHNFSEGRFIAFGLIFVIPVYAVWMAVSYFAPGPFMEPCSAVAVLLVSIVLLVVIFVPKMVAIAQQSRRLHQTKLQQSQPWPQWNRHRQKWTPQQWFGAHRRSASLLSDLYPLYAGGGGGDGSLGSAATTTTTNPYYTRGSRPSGSKAPSAAAAVPPKPHASTSGVCPRHGAVRRHSSSKSIAACRKRHTFNGLNYVGAAAAASSSPAFFYYYGDRDPWARPRRDRRDKTSSAGDTAKPPPPSKPIRVRSRSTAARRPLPVAAASSATSIEGCYPGTVIITPDNESYADDAIWSHKYDTR